MRLSTPSRFTCIHSSLPPNPNHFGSLAARGQKVFALEGCAKCHTPPLYSNNMLTPVEGYKVTEEQRKAYRILPVIVGTDPYNALNTRRGTGFYKVPSLRGVWYRGLFEHNGSIASSRIGSTPIVSMTITYRPAIKAMTLRLVPFRVMSRA